MVRRAIYAGTFDMITLGHEHILKQALPLFDEIIVSVGINPDKPGAMFKLDTRLALIKHVAEDCSRLGMAEVNYGSFPITGPSGQYLVDYAESMEAQFVIRGLRNAEDFEGEKRMAQVNRTVINPSIQSVFFISDSAHANISSSLVKGLMGPRGWEDKVRQCLPKSTHKLFFDYLKFPHLM